MPKNKRNDKISLLYESNKVNQVAVKTAVGLTDRVNMPRVVQQDGTWGSMLCSNSIDTLGKKSRDRGEHHYLYKKTARILPLAMVDDLIGISRCGFESLGLNVFITTQIELKKLRFHVPDKNGKTKCHKIHIGKNHEKCLELKVHETKMKEVKSDTYLGDVISSDGRNTENIKTRVSKGLGIITQITNLLDAVNFGEHYFEIGLLLRDTMLINGVLTNAEIWYNLQKSEIKELEDLDKILLRKPLGAPVSTPGEAFFLELGILPINIIIKSRRINYLHYLLTRKETEMLSIFFFTQWNNPTKGDWCEQIKSDLEEFGISCNFELIKSKTKNAFKNLVKIKAKEQTLKILTEKQSKHSKMSKLHYSEIKIQDYFHLPKVKINQKRTIFKWRTHMENFAENYRGREGPSLCPLCETHLDNQETSVRCPEVKKELNINANIKDVFEEDISLKTIETISEVIKLREKVTKKE